jgi:hypothetical protein
MTIREFVQYCRDVSNKDENGNGFDIDQFNVQIKVVNVEKFQSYWKLAEDMAAAQKEALSAIIFRLQELSDFIEPIYDLTLVSEVGPVYSFRFAAFPSDYRYFMGMIIDDKPADLRPYTEINKFRRGLLNGDPDGRPLVFEGPGMFEFIPNDVKGATLTYLRIPKTPYYDWCLDSNDNEVFMPVGSYVQWNPSLKVFCLFDENGSLMVTSVSRDDFSKLSTYTSKTQELEWEDTMHVHMANAVLEKLGVNLRSPEIVQWTEHQEK